MDKPSQTTGSLPNTANKAVEEASASLFSTPSAALPPTTRRIYGYQLISFLAGYFSHAIIYPIVERIMMQ